MRIPVRPVSEYPFWLRPFFASQRRRYGEVLLPGLLWGRVPRLFAAVALLYGVLDRRLGEVEYVAGSDYSIADIAIWPWAARFEWHLPTIGEYKNVVRWYRTVAQRPAVQRGFDVPSKPEGGIPMP